MTLPEMIVLTAIPTLAGLGAYSLRLRFLRAVLREGGPEHFLIVTQCWSGRLRRRPSEDRPFSGWPEPPSPGW